MSIERILDAARQSGAQAIHPGYGLLSENAEFAAAVTQADLVFVVATPEVIARMGDKVAARAAAEESGIPLLPASARNIASVAEALEAATSIGYPLVIKATFGGGGRGMRGSFANPHKPKPRCRKRPGNRTPRSGRGGNRIWNALSGPPRHVEVQALADAQGHVIGHPARYPPCNAGIRSSSKRRRHRRCLNRLALPSPTAQFALARQVGYRSAGTAEFLFDPRSRQFYFLEMNTRLQVEHGVSELVSGIDLVHSQIHIACGEPLPFIQQDIEIRGSAIQARVAAEDPWSNFQPAAGPVRRLRLPTGPWIRCDFGIESRDAISGHYDSMFGKVQAWAPTREGARKRLIQALSSLEVQGVDTTAPYPLPCWVTPILRRLLTTPGR